MQLTHQSLLRYQGFHGTEGLCHVRIYEQAGRLPVAIVGALDDGPGTSTTNAIEMVAAAVEDACFPDGREFELIEHHPSSIAGDGSPSFGRVRFRHRSIDEDPSDPSHYAGTILSVESDGFDFEPGEPIRGDFRDPSWELIADIERFMGCEVQLWDAGTYTAYAVAGEEGQRLRDEVAARTAEAVNELLDVLEPDS
jgi:hypothetical protein